MKKIIAIWLLISITNQWCGGRDKDLAQAKTEAAAAQQKARVYFIRKNPFEDADTTAAPKATSTHIFWRKLVGNKCVVLHENLIENQDFLIELIVVVVIAGEGLIGRWLRMDRSFFWLNSFIIQIFPVKLILRLREWFESKFSRVWSRFDNQQIVVYFYA